MMNRVLSQIGILWSLLLGFTFTTSVQSIHAAPKTQFGKPALTRSDFNRLAIIANFPLHWTIDKNKNGLIEVNELRAIGSGDTLKTWTYSNRFKPAFKKAYTKLVEMRRKEAVARELNQGRPILITHDFSKLESAEKGMLKALIAASTLIDKLYYRQTGAERYRKQIAKTDSASKALIKRNSGPWCHAPGTRNDPFCNGLASFADRRSETYPLDEKQDKAFCKKLAQQANAKELLDPFTVVRKDKKGYKAIPLHKAYPREMKAIAKLLIRAGKSIGTLDREKALAQYLFAAANGFRTNDWEKADDAWAAMNSDNSRWYLRIGPDEVYVDPCQQKAGFHLVIARIDPSSLEWKRRLQPLRSEMEKRFADLIGKDYKAREVNFNMPDFIDVVLNSGDSRHPLGATIGQSLPNWGKVAKEGRRRTMQMSNLYTDPDSLIIKEKKAKALFCKKTLKYFTKDLGPSQLDTILHEAGHNFGPDSGFRVQGKQAKEIFGGALASTLEELKAQTLSLWYLQLLRKKGVLSDDALKQGYVDSILWAFGHISRGMTGAGGQPEPYSRLAAIQVGSFMEAGAITYNKGKFTIHFSRMPGAIESLLKRVGQIKARGDKKDGARLVERYIKDKALNKIHYSYLKDQLLKYPKAAFDYEIVY